MGNEWHAATASWQEQGKWAEALSGATMHFACK